MNHEAFILAIQRFARERKLSWDSDEIAEQIRAWWPRFENIDAEILAAELSVEMHARYASLQDVLARCREAQAAKAAKAPPQERPKPPLSRDETALYAHAAKLVADALPRKLSMAQALAQVRREKNSEQE